MHFGTSAAFGLYRLFLNTLFDFLKNLECNVVLDCVYKCSDGGRVNGVLVHIPVLTLVSLRESPNHKLLLYTQVNKCIPARAETPLCLINFVVLILSSLK